jgi:class 3 adenylate cyclase
LQRRGALKIETIGDAILVASGVPESVPLKQSARTIAKVAIDMLAAVRTFDVALKNKLKGHKLIARVGIHCGTALAGVVGEDMPRYQLFGPVVDEVQVRCHLMLFFVERQPQLSPPIVSVVF